MKKCTIKFPHLGNIEVVVYANCKVPKLFLFEGAKFVRGAVLEDRENNRMNVWIEKFDKRDPYYLGVIAHEMYHACEEIHAWRNIPNGAGDDGEAFAYHLQYLVETVIRKFSS